MIDIILGWVGGSLSYTAVYMSSYRIQYRRLYRKYLEWKAAGPNERVTIVHEYDEYMPPDIRHTVRRHVAFKDWRVSVLPGRPTNVPPTAMILWPVVLLIIGVYVTCGVVKRVVHPFMHPKIELGERKSKRIKPRKRGLDYDKIQKLEKELFKDG
jgi:hypothetical protein